MYFRIYQIVKDGLFSAGSIALLGFGLGALMVVGGLTACSSATPAPQPDQLPETQASYAGKKILWIDSYHEEYEWSSGIETGIRNVLQDTGVELKVVRLDTKRNTGDEFGQQAALQAKAELEAFAPDVVIASDDNAQKYLIVPYLKDTTTPVVFAGVNWDASEYGYPASNVTGMIEVELPAQQVEHLRPYAQGDRIAYLTVDSNTERKVAQIYNERFFSEEMGTVFVKTFDEFKDAFIQIQEEVDILFIGNNAGIDRWDPAEAEDFIAQNTRIPTGTINPWLAPYALITLAKSPEEQGQWSARAALSILDGTPISEIPVAENKQGKMILNLEIAEQLDVVFPPTVLKNAEVYSPEEDS